MIREERNLVLEVVAEDAVISSREAVSLGLVVTELVINALKHAFPHGRGGAIAVRYGVEADGWAMSIGDNGVGMPADAPTTKAGLGTSIVQGLAQQLRATIAYVDAEPGLRVDLRMVRPQPSAG